MASSSVSLAGSALSALGALRQAGQPSPGTLSSDNTPIEIDVPPEAHIEITNIKLNATSTNFSGGSFTIKNVDNKDLIAYSLTMNLYFDINPDRPIGMGITEDGWFLNQYVLKPGESREGMIRTSLTAPQPVKLSKITIVPDYIEFSGAPALGSNPSLVGASLKKTRDTKAEVLGGYCAKIKSGESPDSVASLIKSGPVSAKGQQMAVSVLSTFIDQHGADGLANACSESPQSRAY